MSRTAIGIDIGFFASGRQKSSSLGLFAGISIFDLNTGENAGFVENVGFQYEYTSRVVFPNNHKFAFRLRQNLLNMEVNDSKHLVHYINP